MSSGNIQHSQFRIFKGKTRIPAVSFSNRKRTIHCVHLPSHGKVAKRSILKTVLLLQLFRQLTCETDQSVFCSEGEYSRCFSAVLSIFVNKPLRTTSSLTELLARFGYVWLSQETPKERNRQFFLKYVRYVQKYWFLKTKQNIDVLGLNWILSACTYEAKALMAVATTG